MADVTHQAHSKFKMFTGKLGADFSLGKLATDVEQFAQKARAAAKSIGIEYLEHSKLVVVTLGYRDDEPAYPIKLHAVRLGNADRLDAGDLERLERKMGEEAAKLSNVICHELFITESHEFLMVLMTHQG